MHLICIHFFLSLFLKCDWTNFVCTNIEDFGTFLRAVQDPDVYQLISSINQNCHPDQFCDIIDISNMHPVSTAVRLNHTYTSLSTCRCSKINERIFSFDEIAQCQEIE